MTARKGAPSRDGNGNAEPFGLVAPPSLRSVEEVITATLRDAIRRGELRPGDRLRQDALAEQLHVSRIPLRDALRRLEVEHLVRIDARRGAQVVALSPEDVTEIHELLEILEEAALRLAVRSLDADDVERLLELSDRMDAVLKEPVAGSEARRSFYAALYENAGRPLLTLTIMRLRDSLQRYHVLKRTDVARHDHAELRRAIAARDADAAVKTHLAHLRRNCDDLVDVLEEERRVAGWHDDGGDARHARMAEVSNVQPTPSAEESVTAALRDKILRGEFAPGARLLQDQLAASFGVSRIPLRDALRRLEVEGLVRIDPRHGAYVGELSVADVEAIYELREMLEPRCMRYAVRSLDAAAITETLLMSAAMDEKVSTADEGRKRRRAFYATLYGRAGKPRMAELIIRLRDDVSRYHVLANVDESLHAHDELRERIRRRDAESAAAAIANHVRSAGDDLVAVLRKQEARYRKGPADTGGATDDRATVARGGIDTPRARAPSAASLRRHVAGRGNRGDRSAPVD